MVVKSFRDLEIWKRSMSLVKEVYIITDNFPQKEIYSLTNQIRRAAVSIPSNIAEGHIRQYASEFRQFLYISLGSLAEMETQLLIACELGYIQRKAIDHIVKEIDEIGRMIRSIIKKLIAKGMN